MDKIKLSICILLTLFTTSVLGQGVTNHAVLIGVDQYKYWSTPSQLKQNIAGVLQFFKTSQKYHFKLTQLINEDVYVDNIKKTLENLQVNRGDYVMIYLAGHGCQVPDVSEKKKNTMHQGFVCYNTPVLGNPEFQDKVLLGDSLGVWLRTLRRRIGSAGQVFILAECCYSGLIDRGPGKKENKQTQFIEENISNLKDLAPLIVFSSSRSFNQTASFQKFTLTFLSEFKKFTKGSYYDLFGKFYLAQRKEILEEGDIELSVNLDVDDANYLRMGVFEDSIYPSNNFTRIINISANYKDDHQFEINTGVFEGVTLGSTVKVTCANQKQFLGRVDVVKNGSSSVTLLANPIPPKTDLWKSKVQIDSYNFRDTLLVSIDAAVPDSIQKEIKARLNDLKFIALNETPSVDGYTILYKDEKLFILRNKDTSGIYKVQGMQDLKSTLVKIEISHFIRQLHTTKDSTVSLVLTCKSVPLSDMDLYQVKPGDSLVIRVHSNGSDKDKFYCVLHLQDEFISQLVPVNFQDNESECKLPNHVNKDILIDSIEVGKTDGSFFLITSETPFDLKDVLLKPLTKSRSGKKPNKMEKIIDGLFLDKDKNKPLYNPDILKIEKRDYKIEKLSPVTN